MAQFVERSPPVRKFISKTLEMVLVVFSLGAQDMRTEQGDKTLKRVSVIYTEYFKEAVVSVENE